MHYCHSLLTSAVEMQHSANRHNLWGNDNLGKNPKLIVILED